jgi:GT2 family glycosyltransferase
MSETPLLSIVVPVLDQADRTVQCFHSLRINTKLPYELVWIDNCSKKESFDVILRQVKQGIPCKLIKNPNNYGFIKATNQGIKEAKGEIIVLLNNDTLVYPNWDTELVQPLLTKNNIGAVGPLTQSRIAWQEAHYINDRYGTALPTYRDSYGLGNTYAKILLDKYKNKYMEVSKDLSLAFFCTAIRKETFVKLGGLCEEMVIGLGDDDDFCFRLRLNNYRILLSLGTFIHHAHRTTFNALKIGEHSIRARNMKVFKKRMKVFIEEKNKTDSAKFVVS